jgi:hypothetical protein
MISSISLFRLFALEITNERGLIEELAFLHSFFIALVSENRKTNMNIANINILPKYKVHLV